MQRDAQISRMTQRVALLFDRISDLVNVFGIVREPLRSLFEVRLAWNC